MRDPVYADFEKLFRQLNRELCNLAYNLVHDKEAAKDIVQDVFLKLWKNRNQVEWGDQIKRYLFKATSHTALNHLRFHKKIITINRADGVWQKMEAPRGHEDIAYTELELRARQAIDELPPRCKVIYILSRQEGMKYQEIAETLNLSVKTVENQMGKALEKLRQRLKPFLPIEFLLFIVLIAFTIFLLT